MRMQTMLCMAAILTTCVCANGQPFFEDDFEDGAISPTLWQTNNQGWYSYTDVWLDAEWAESDGMLHVSGDGDFIPMQMLFSQDSTDVVYHFAVEIAAGANAGIALAPDPFGTPPADDRVQFILSTEADGGVHTRRRIDDVIIVDQLDHAGQILPDVLYDVTLTVTTEGGVTTVAHDITGLGSGSAEMAAIDSGYQSVLWARGSWGSGANASFDYITVSEVPEPATMSLLALGGVALLRRRRK